MNLIFIIKKFLKEKLEEKIISRTTFRFLISNNYLIGNGIEIGALHNPLRINSNNAKVLYIDRMSKEDLLTHYPEFKKVKLVDVDIIDNGEKLITIEDSSQNFIIANHMLEHCINPILTIETFISKLKKGGKIYLSIPDKRFTFDKYRKLTSYEHLLSDYKESETTSQVHHYEEWVEYCENLNRDNEKFKTIVNERLNMNYSIHFHVWDFDTFLEFLIKTKELLNYSFSIVAFLQNNEEIISILEKN
jgi:predicted SAM-dependent methyltransferase